MEHTPKPCGCELRIQEVDGHLDTQSFKFCPLHAAAPALLEALEWYANREVHQWGPAGREPDIIFDKGHRARAAIKLAKGESN